MEASRHDVSGGVLLNELHQQRLRLFEEGLAEMVQLRKEFDRDKRELWESRLTVRTDWGWTKHYAPVKTEEAKVEQTERRNLWNS